MSTSSVCRHGRNPSALNKLAILLALPVILLLAGCSGTGVSASGGGEGKKGGKKGFGSGDVPVTVATVAQRDVPVEIPVIGNVEAYRTISVRAQIGGELTSVNF